MAGQLTLYFAPGASSMAPHIALHEIGVPFEARPISVRKCENRTPEFLAINPEGRIPVLLIDGRPLTEVAAILLYLAERFPQAGLLPASDVERRAQVISWMSFLASTVHPARLQGANYAIEIFKLAERRLGAREWAIGAYSIADIHLFRLFWRLRNSLALPPAEFPDLTAHYERMMQRPAVQKTFEVEAAIGYELPA